MSEEVACQDAGTHDEQVIFTEDYASFLEEQLRCLDDAPCSLDGNEMSTRCLAQAKSRELAAELQRALARCPSMVASSLSTRKRERLHPLLAHPEGTGDLSQASQMRSPRPTLTPQPLCELDAFPPRSFSKSIESCGTSATASTRASCDGSLEDTPRSLGRSSDSSQPEALTPNSLGSHMEHGHTPGSASSVDGAARRLLAVVELDESPERRLEPCLALHSKQSTGSSSESRTTSKASAAKRSGHWLLAPKR